ncbi:DUF262 domain-containing protein [Microbacterium sp. JC 701]|uniref:GmrSD restriction endonuclease domain-containing protein n=1 Tax=Microbacterium sp. JC 701 TaxID=2897389 RepID=UPI001E52A7FD|nr:DUF262 domain-containing protein [Microbacterium sp. JC 701]MCD2169568.1 DUF262 domain-containing protein [Microbacterium sp. JC 701]
MAELDSQPKSIQSLYVWFAEGKLTVNRRYQRKLVWTLEEKQRLIESLMKRYPIPAVLLAEQPDGGYEIIDGLQRLHSIVSFIETGFVTLDGEHFDVAQFFTANERSAEGHFEKRDSGKLISKRDVGSILDYTLAVSIMRGADEEEINDVFGRINTYGHRLSDQERRQAGVQDQFSELVRELACVLRGDASSATLDLSKMPSISIDLPKTKHGYDVQADEVFWVIHGVLRSTDLRDSMDEQCIADIAACVVGGILLERSKDALDAVYERGSSENSRIATALNVYGVDALTDEIKYCIDEILKVASAGTASKLRDILFSKRTNNAFPAIFATLVIAFHEVLIGGKKKITDYAAVKTVITKLDNRIDTGRGSTTVVERRKNVDAVKGLLNNHVADSDLAGVYSNQSIADIDAAIRRSEIELPDYELKQGMLSLGPQRSMPSGFMTKIVRTICAIANNGPTHGGTLIIGVTDKPSDAVKIKALDGITPRRVGHRDVVGVRREMVILGETPEVYFSRWKNAIKNSALSTPLVESVLSSMSYHDYFGLGVIVISVPPQKALSFVGKDIFYRSADDTMLADDGLTIAGLAARFA